MTLQVLMPQKQSDPLDQIAKGLQIAQAIYGIKTSMQQSKLAETSQKMKDEDLAKTKLASTLVKEGAYTPREFNENFVEVDDRSTFKKNQNLPESFAGFRTIRVLDPESTADKPKFKEKVAVSLTDLQSGKERFLKNLEYNEKLEKRKIELEDNIFDDFKQDQVVKKATDQLLNVSQADAAMDLVRKGDAGALGTVTTLVASAVQSGVLTDEDIARASGQPVGVVGKTSDQIRMYLQGTAPEYQIQTLEKLLLAAKTNANKQLGERIKWYTDKAIGYGVDPKNIIPPGIFQRLDTTEQISEQQASPTFNIIPQAQATPDQNLDQTKQDLELFLKRNR